jgi:ubiquitin thioesterase protein OTUB1
MDLSAFGQSVRDLPRAVGELFGVPSEPQRWEEDDEQLRRALEESALAVAQLPPPDCHRKCPLRELGEAQSNPSIKAKIAVLSRRYAHVRKIRGEGNCFFRSFWMGWLERAIPFLGVAEAPHPLLNNLYQPAWAWRIEELSSAAARTLIGPRRQEVVEYGRRFVDVTRRLCHAYVTGGEAAFVDKACQHAETAGALYWLRLMASAYIQRPDVRDEWSPHFEGLCVEDFCAQQVERDEALADELQITALTTALGLGVRVEYLNSESYPWSQRCGPHWHKLLLPLAPRTGHAPVLAACVLFRPGHYDLLLPDEDRWTDPTLLAPDAAELVPPLPPPPPPARALCPACNQPMMASCCWLCEASICTHPRCPVASRAAAAGASGVHGAHLYMLPACFGAQGPGAVCPTCIAKLPLLATTAADGPPPGSATADQTKLWRCAESDRLGFADELRGARQLGDRRGGWPPPAPASHAPMRMEDVLTLYDANGDGVFDFNEFIQLVSDLICLRDGVLFAPPQAGRNLAEVLAKQIPGPARDTIEVAHLVELDGRWASLITQPDMVAAGGDGLRSLSDQGLHGDLKDLRAQRVVWVVTLYDSNGDGVFDFDEFIQLVSDLLCLRDGVLYAPPKAGRNLAEVLAKQIPGPARHTIEVAHLVELDGRWASLITLPDVVAAGGAGLRSLSDQRLHGDLDNLHAWRQAELVSGATRSYRIPGVQVVPLEAISQQSSIEPHATPPPLPTTSARTPACTAAASTAAYPAASEAAATEDRTVTRAQQGLPRVQPASRAVQPARQPQRPALRPAPQHVWPPPAPPPAPPPPPPFSGTIDIATLPFQNETQRRKVERQWKMAQEVGHLGPLKILEHLGYRRREAEEALDSNDKDVLRAILCLNGIDLQGTSTAARATPFVNPNIPLSEQERRSMAASRNALTAAADVPLTQEECDPAAGWERLERPSDDPFNHPYIHHLRR